MIFHGSSDTISSRIRTCMLRQHSTTRSHTFFAKNLKNYITQDVCNQFNAKCPCDPLCSSTIQMAPYSPGMDVPALRTTNPTRRHIFIAQCKKHSITQDMGKNFNAEYPGDTLLFHNSNDIIPTWKWRCLLREHLATRRHIFCPESKNISISTTFSLVTISCPGYPIEPFY